MKRADTPQRRPLLGLCPIGKFVFSHEDAILQKRALQSRLVEWNSDFVDLDEVLPDGLVRDQNQVDDAVRHLKARGIDALFLPHCNFGTEGAAAMIARKLDVPTLLWGPRDEKPLPDGSRSRDSLCGMFATSKVLRKLGVTFTYIENCRLDDIQLKDGVDMFLRAANAANLFRKGCRIGHIGQRIDFFWTTIVNESELLERFNIEILPIDMVEFIHGVRDRARSGRAGYEKEVAELRRESIIEGFDDTDEPLVNILAVRDQMLAVTTDNGLEGIALQTFQSLIDEIGAYACYSGSAYSDRFAFGMESDIHGTISSALVRRAQLDTVPAFLSDVTVRHPEDDNGVLLWHTDAPLSFLHPEERIRLGYHWILPSPLSGMTHFRLKDGPITVARFDGDTGNYKLAVGTGTSISGPDTLNNYVWMKVNDWPSWERTLMEGPFIHHMAMTYGNVGDALIEASRYVEGLEPVILG